MNKILEARMRFVDGVNAATQRSQRILHRGALDGFDACLEAMGWNSAMVGSLSMACDTVQFERGNGNRPMCGGEFLDLPELES